jgi:DNA-binding response OmpR family regulator
MFHVLVIEEGLRARERLLHVLSEAGYAVAEAQDGRTALELVRARRPDVIVHGRVTSSTSEFLTVRKTDPVLSGIALIMTVTRPELAEGADVCLNDRFTLDDLLAALARCEERAHVAARRVFAREECGIDATSRR